MAAGFMAGFGSTMSKLIEDDREYYRELATKKRDYLQTYGTRAVLERDEKANGAVSLFNSLVSAGIPQDDLRYVLDTTGVPGLTELKSTLSTRDDLTPSQIQGLIQKSKDYVADNPNEDITEVIRRAYGLYKSTDNPVEQETNMFAAVLGLDARMMEQDVMNDTYMGYSGADLTRIAASPGPKPGEALKLNLPTRPASARSQELAGKTLLNQFDRSINAKIAEQRRILAAPPSEAAGKAAKKEIEKLEGIQAQGAAGIYKYAIEQDPALLTSAKILETETPGIITRNSLSLPGFSTEFASWYGDLQDDAKIDSTATGPSGPASDTLPNNGDTPETYTPTELRAALAKGELAVGTKVKVNGNEVVITQAQIDKAQEKTPGLTNDDMGLPDDPVNLGLTDDDMGLPDGPIPKSLIPAIQAGANTTEWIASSDEDFKTALTSGFYSVSAATERGLATAIDYLTGVLGGTEETGASKGLKKSSEYMAERAAEVAAKGFTEYWTSDLEEGNEFKPEFPGDVPDEVVKEVRGSYLDAIKDMLGIGESSETRMVNGEPMTNAEILAAARAQLDDAANARIDMAVRRGSLIPPKADTNTIELEFGPEFPGDVPSNLEEASTETISKALRFLTEIPARSHQFLFDTQDKINTSIASLFEETLEERIMKNEGQRNRVVALQALKDKIAEMRKAAEAEESVVPEALVSRRKKPIEPKGMTASDKARLKRAQKANELSGDSALLEMLVEKYGLAIVQKEMGY